MNANASSLGVDQSKLPSSAIKPSSGGSLPCHALTRSGRRHAREPQEMALRWDGRDTAKWPLACTGQTISEWKLPTENEQLILRAGQFRDADRIYAGAHPPQSRLDNRRNAE